MSNRIVKSLTMLALVAGLALAANVLSANGQSHRVIADIPFDFIVADKTLPSGNYTVSAATSDGQALKISSRDGKSSIIRLSTSLAEKSEKRNARMVFHRYGQQYFLVEVWSGDSYGRKLGQCKRERNLQRELAFNGSTSDSSYEIVEVVALVH